MTPSPLSGVHPPLLKKGPMFPDVQTTDRPLETIRLFALVVFALLQAGGAPVRAESEKCLSLSRPMMGTVVEITACAGDDVRVSGAMEKAFREMERIEGLLSVRKKSSVISKINRNAFHRGVIVDEEVFGLLEESVRYWRLTDGAFDITVGPLLELWPIYRTEKKLPTQEQLSRALLLTGSDKILLDRASRTVRLALPGMALDLGGIAKGYAIDRAMEILRREGVGSALVNGGGDLHAMGRKPDGSRWRVGVRHPRVPSELIAVLEAHSMALMTSGDYERFFIKDGKRYSHIIDPRTGFTARGTASVTIAAPSATEGDALATGVLVLGAERGLRLVETLPHVECAILTQGDAKTLRLTVSGGFREVFRVDAEKLAY